MKIKQKILIYSVIFILYITLTISFFKASEYVDFDPFYPLLFFLGIINCSYLFKYLKLPLWLSIFFSVIVVALSVICSFKTVDFGLYPESDSYGIMSSIIYYGIFTIIFLEIIYHTRNRFNFR